MAPLHIAIVQCIRLNVHGSSCSTNVTGRLRNRLNSAYLNFSADCNYEQKQKDNAIKILYYWITSKKLGEKASSCLCQPCSPGKIVPELVLPITSRVFRSETLMWNKSVRDGPVTHFTLHCYRIDAWAIRRPWLTFVNALANSMLGRFYTARTQRFA